MPPLSASPRTPLTAHERRLPSNPMQPSYGGPQQAPSPPMQDPRGLLTDDYALRSGYHEVLQDARARIDGAMNPFQRKLGRVIAATGTMASIGGGVAVGVLGVASLTSLATGVGVPVAASAAVTGVAVGLLGLGVTLLTSMAVRALVRRPLRKNPEIRQLMTQLLVLKSELEGTGKKTKADKALLKDINRTLGKVGGAKMSAKHLCLDMVGSVAGAAGAVLALAVAVGAGFVDTPGVTNNSSPHFGCSGRSSYSTKAINSVRPEQATITLNDKAERLAGLQQATANIRSRR